jgi:glycerophosphoryl diester phosphodiesterase
MHDEKVDRTTDGTGNVSALTWTAIRALDAGSWKDAKFTGRYDCKVPGLSEVLDAFQYKPIFIQLHFAVVLTNADMYAIINNIIDRGILYQVIFSASIVQINTIKAYAKDALTCNDGMPYIATYNTALQNAITNGHFAVSINGVDETDANLQTMINAIHAAGKKAHISYVSADYATKIGKLISYGADMILGNNPIAMKAVMDSNGLMQAEPIRMYAKDNWWKPVKAVYIRNKKWVETLKAGSFQV